MQEQNQSPTIHIVLPCYNEELNLKPLFENFESIFSIIKNLGLTRKYVIVDDGSKDKSPEILKELAQQYPLHVITHNPNKGLGETIKDGLQYASETAHPNDIIISMDADNTQPAKLIFNMILKVLEGNEVVIASRYRYGAKVVGLAYHRELISICAGILFKVSYNIKDVRDYTCGFRAYKASVLKAAFAKYGDKFIEQKGFQCMAEILLKLKKVNKHTIFCEVPMVLRYDLKGGESKMKVVKTIIDTIKMLVLFRFR